MKSDCGLLLKLLEILTSNFATGSIVNSKHSFVFFTQ